MITPSRRGPTRKTHHRRLNLEALEHRHVLDSTVVFNELHYHPADNTAAPEWIELHNQMAVDMDISGWRLDGGVDFSFAEGTILPGGGYLVIAADVAGLEAAAGFSDALGPFRGRLDNGGEGITLLNNDNRIMDAVEYGDSGDWPVAPDGSGASLSKNDADLASEDARNWRASIQVGGTPGERNFASDIPIFETVVESGDTARYFIPIDDSLGSTWTVSGFDDSTWSEGTTGIGYDTFELDYVAEVLSDGPLGFWQFEETSGSTAFDSSGNGNDATYTGGVTLGTGGVLAGDDDSSARFDGSSGRIFLPGTWGGPEWTETTIEAWVNTADPITGDFQSIVSGHDPNAFAHFQLHSAGNTGIYTDAGFVATPIIPATPTNQWRHVVITSRSGESKVYVDGQQLGSTVGSVYGSIAASNNVTIGQGHQNGRWFRGNIDEVAIYDHVLPPERIFTHFLAAGAGQFDPDPEPDDAELLAHWPFDDDAADETGNHDATLGGGATITGDAAIGGGALDLRGVDGYADVPSTVLDAEDSFSIAFWVAADSLNDVCCSSIYSNDAWSPGKLRVNVDSATRAVELGINSNSEFPRSTGAVGADGSWTHVALTYDSATGAATAYFDGEAEPGVTLETAGPVGVGPTAIGAWDATGNGLYTRFLDGRLDELRVYRGVLTANQVRELAATPEPIELLAHWTFDSDASDVTGNHHGSLEGGAQITANAAVGAGALDLRGVNGYVDVPTATLDGQSSFTIATFVSVDALTHACCAALFTNDSWSTGKLHLNVATASAVPELAINGNPAGAWARDAAIPIDGSWVHLAFTYDSAGGVSTPYINGVAGNAGVGGTITSVGAGPVNIGAWDTTGSNTQDRFLEGRIDDLRVYSGALTAAEIADLAALGGAQAGDVGSLPISAFRVISTDIEDQMLKVNSSAYVRTNFTIPNAAAVDQLILKMKYDDAFVAYINGVEVARRNAPQQLTYDAAAIAERPNSSSVVFERFDLADSLDTLVDGTNVLAIQGLNFSRDDDDFLVLPELIIHEADIEVAAVAINEVAGATDNEFTVELMNYGTMAVQVGGYHLVRSSELDRGYVFPVQTLPAGGFLTITETELGFRPFDGERLFLYTSDRRGVLDAVRVDDVRRGRSPDGTGRWLQPDVATNDRANSFSIHNEIVINEIMYHHQPTPATPDTPAQYSVETFLPINATWNYEASGADLGTGWREVGFDDSQWASGPGLLGFETSPASLPESLPTFIAPHGGLTYYFRTEFEFHGDPNSVNMSLRHVIDDGAVIYLNGQEWYRVGMAPGEVTDSTTADRTIGNAAYEGPFSMPTDALIVGTNTLAVEVHQWGPTSSDMVMGLELSERMLVTQPIPGEPFEASAEEWIELYNRGNAAVELTGWSLQGGIDHDFATGTNIAAGEFLVVAKDSQTLRVRYPDIPIVGDYNGRLNNGTDFIRLEDANGNPADEVRYHDDGRWSFYADGGGSSLELTDPDADNSQPEAWAASDEAADARWSTYSYRGFAIADIGPTNFHELIVGLLDSGEVLLDDIRVVESPGRPEQRQLIQNGDFEGGDTDRWRLLGNHGDSSVVSDPDNAANQVFHLVATGPTEHLSNHAETTLKDGDTIVTVSGGREYEISFRAKWLAGSRQLRTNLYFNRLPQVTILDAPDLNGTPGQPNSTLELNIGPTYDNFQHTPVVPAAGEPVTVSVVAADPDNIAALTLWYSVDDGAFSGVPMTSSRDGVYTGLVPGQSASAIVQFFVEGTDSLGAHSMFPAAGRDSRALYKVQDGLAELSEVHNFRIIMTPADTDFLHTNTNLMSNDFMGATIVYDENQVFYDAGVRLKGTPYGRPFDQFVSYIVHFPPDNLFRGVHDSVAVDRSARGPVGSPNVDEILIRHVFDHAGGVASQYADIIRVITPRGSHTSIAQLNMARYGDVYLDSSFDNGGDFPTFEFDGAYYLTRTIDGTPEGLKVVEPGPISYTDIRDLGDTKEPYRNNWIIKDNRAEDDYSSIIELNKSFDLTSSELDAAIGDVIDVDQWARHYAVLSLTGVSDTYTHGNPHNLRVYQRPEDGRFISLPHDMDTSFSRSTSVGLMGGSNWNLVKIFRRPQYTRLFYGNLHNLIETTYNTEYMSRWTEHYGDLANTSFAGILSYIGSRASFVQSQLASLAPPVPFAITANGGLDFSVAAGVVTLDGTGWINVHKIRLAGSDDSLDVTWLDMDNWQAQIPLAFGSNLLTLEAVDRHGEIVGTDSITVTSTVSERPYQDFLRITELHYNPAGSDDTEFIELRNISSGPAATVLDLSQVAIVDGPSAPYIFTSGRMLAAGEFVLVVKDLAAFASTYPNVDSALIDGEFSGSLNNAGEVIRLNDPNGAAILNFAYGENDPWPESADGVGASLELIDSTDAPGDQFGKYYRWRGSARYGGSPGTVGQAPIGVVVNEVLTHTDPPITQSDSIELLNTTAAAVDIGGWFLSDSADNLLKYEIPADTLLGPGEYVVFDEDDFNPSRGVDPELHPTDFALSGTNGDDVWLVMPNGDGGVQEFVDDVHFGGALNGISFGRVDGADHRLAPLSTTSLGCDNSHPSIGPLVITEVDYNPSEPSATALAIDPSVTRGDLEFVEIYNPTSTPVDLAGWRVRGGIELDFDGGTTINAGQALVVIRFNPGNQDNADRVSAFRAHFGIDASVMLIGGYSGQLSNEGERVTLQRPDQPPLDDPGFTPHVIEDEVLYDDLEPWPSTANGQSLGRVSPIHFGNASAAWIASAPTPGIVSFSPGTTGDMTGDGIVDVSDIDLLNAMINRGTTVGAYDLDDSGAVDSADRLFLLESVLGTFEGDANLDGRVDAQDLNAVGVSWRRIGDCLRWSDGNFDGDRDIDASDLNALGINWQAGVAAGPARPPRAPLAMRAAVIDAMLAGMVAAALDRPRSDFVSADAVQDAVAPEVVFAQQWLSQRAVRRHIGSDADGQNALERAGKIDLVKLDLEVWGNWR